MFGKKKLLTVCLFTKTLEEGLELVLPLCPPDRCTSSKIPIITSRARKKMLFSPFMTIRCLVGGGLNVHLRDR